MDIRNFFGPAGASKKPSTQTKPAAPPTKPRTLNTKGKNAPKSSKKQTSRTNPSPKFVKNKPPQLQEEDEDDDVAIISVSDEEPAGRKVSGRTNGKETSPSKARRKNPSAEKNKKAQATEKNGSKSKSATPEARSKGKTKLTVLNGDSDGEVPRKEGKSKTPNKTKSKTTVVDSEPDRDEDSPVKRPSASKNKRRVLEISDSEEEEVKPKRGPKRSKQNLDDKVQPKTKGSRIIDSDSGENEEEPQPKKKRGRRKKEAVVFVDDSDEDRKPRKGSLDAFVTHNAPPTSKVTEAKKPPEGKKQTITAADFFGGGAVHRTDRPTPPAKRKVTDTVDVEFHDDEDFAKTLGELDREQAKKPRRDVSPKKEMADVEEVPAEVSSLASKLSARMKTAGPAATPATMTRSSPLKRDTNSNVVLDTPDKRKGVIAFAQTPKKGASARASPVKGVGKMEVTKMEKKPAPSSAEKKTPSKAADQSRPSSAEKKTPVTSTSKESSNKGSAKRNWGAYRSFLHREGPRALGSKEIPEGAENCLEGLTFVITGVLESIDRDEAKSLVERYGGKVTGSISNRTSYLVVGRDPGDSKIRKAEQCRTKQVDEDGLLDLVRTLPGKKSKYEEKAEQALKKEQSLQKSSSGKFTSLKASESKLSRNDSIGSDNGVDEPDPARGQATGATGSGDVSLMWVDKHKPASLKQIIGQQGDKSNARKLLSWIQKWHKNRAAGVKPAGRFYGQDDGSGHRAALLSGPPGIGKTTSAVLVCKEAGFSTVELNASDKRSKRSLKEDVAEALNNQTLVDYMGEGSSTTSGTRGEKHCLIMDEVDGMAGNEDRGGLQELVQLIKTTRIPIICICNDRNSMKMRTLSNYCFDLRFQRPRLEQIKGALMSIAFKEGLKISAPALQEIILSSNQDIRQCIHNMSMWTANHKELSYDQAKRDAKQAQKDVRMGIFDVSRKIFAGGEETAKMTLNDKSDLFFQDYSFVPLFVHENYVGVTPYAARGDRSRHLSLLARTAESISDGDLVDRLVRGNGNWNLLPTQAMLASVIPGEYMRGAVSHMIQFPAWLGKNSTTGKNDRVLQELRAHMALQLSCDKRGLNMDYLPALRSRLTEPLAKQGSEGVPRVIQLMDDYDIIKDDYDNILEITKWPNSKDPLAHLDSKTKAAFTRQYNKESHLTPYATGAAPKKKRGRGPTVAEDYEMEEGEEGAAAAVSESEEEEEGLERETMIKVRKKSDQAPASTSKGKGSAKGKGPAKGKANSIKGKGRR